MSSVDEPANPNKQLTIPKWINENYFVDILKNQFSNFSTIKKFTTVAATGPGENFTSTMIRVKIEIQLKDGSTTDVSYILKTTLESVTAGELVNSMNLFPKEKEAYQLFLPQFETLYRDNGKDLKIGPKCLHIDETSTRITLIMEDLKGKNFKNANRLEGFDMKHMTEALKKLAQFHAVSAVWNELNGPFPEKFHKSFFDASNAEVFENYFSLKNKIQLKAMQTWGLEDVEYYIKKLPTFQFYTNQFIQLTISDPTEFNVLNHGDCWCNNIMFSYNDCGEIKETLFVDFQVGRWGCPSQDLWYLIITSAAIDIKIKEFDRFIQIYHRHLVQCLKLLKYSKKIPTLKDIHIQMIKYGGWGYSTADGVMSVVLLQPDKDANIDMMMKDGEDADQLRWKIFSNPLYARAMREILPFLDKRGVMDFHD